MDYNPFNKSAGSLKSVQEKKMMCEKCGKMHENGDECEMDDDEKNEAMDPVNKKELKGKHADRKDKDLDNDGDADSSDKYLHKRRKAISKAMDEGIVDKAKQGIAKLKSMTPAAKQAARDAENERRLDAVSKHYVRNAVDASKSKKNKAEAKGGDKEGDVEMNPKMKKEGMKESRIRSALKSVLSEKKDDHTKNATKAETMDDKLSGKGAKDMMAGAKAEIAKGPDAHLDEPAIDKKNFEGQTKSIPAAKARNAGDNIGSGESKIKPSATPVKDPATTADATDGGFVTNKKKSVKESSMSGPDRNHSIVSAYASMMKKDES